MFVYYVFPLIMGKASEQVEILYFSCSTTWPSSLDLLGEKTQVFWLTDSVAAMLWARSLLLRAFEIKANVWVICFSQAGLPKDSGMLLGNNSYLSSHTQEVL